MRFAVAAWLAPVALGIAPTAGYAQNPHPRFDLAGGVTWLDTTEIVKAPAAGWAVSGLLLSSVRTKPRFNPSYERRRCAFVASWLSAAGASTGQGSAQRSAGGGVALTRAERGGIRRLGCRSPSTLILRGGTASDCRRIFGPSREHARLRATMVNARGDANRWYGPVWPAPVVGVSPRRSDRCAILSRGSPPGEITVQWSPRGYAAMRVSATKGRSSRHTRHTIRASRLAIAAVAMFAPRRAAIARAQVRNGVVF